MIKNTLAAEKSQQLALAMEIAFLIEENKFVRNALQLPAGKWPNEFHEASQLRASQGSKQLDGP